MLATIAQFGDDGWQRLLDASCARTTCSSSTAGRTPTTRASPAARARRPARRRLVCDRARRRRSIFATRDRDDAPTGVVLEHVLPPDRVRGRPARDAQTRTGARKLVDFLLSRALPGGHAAEDVRVPGRATARRCPAVFTQFAEGRRHPLELRRPRDRREPRRWIERVDGHWWCAERPRRASAARCSCGVPLAFLGALLRLPARRDPRRGLLRRRLDLSRARVDVLTDRALRATSSGSRSGRRSRRPR